MKDLREFLELLEDRGQLKRITVPVSAELEITEIADRTVKSGGPALYFENVEGYKMPVAINLFGTHQRMAWALGVDHIDALSDKVNDLLSLAQGPPSGFSGKMKALGDLIGLARSQPKEVKKGPCQEEIFLGDEVDLTTLPILKCWPMDAGRFITLPSVISRDPETGRRNMGTYRMQVFDHKTTGMHWQTHKVGARHYRKGERRDDNKLEVAVAIGGDPVTMWVGSLPLPPDMEEITVSSLIRGKPVEMVHCKTVDLEVPAHAEIILEGYVVPGETRIEGPFGDHTGYYSSPNLYPIFHITAMTRRSDAIYPTTIVGRPPTEDFFMGKASERLMLPALQMVLPEVVDINMPAEGIFHNLVLVSIHKEYPGHARKVMHALWGLGLLALTKTIVVFDDHVDIQNLSEAAWRTTANIDPETDIVFSEGPADDLDHASHTHKFGSKLGIDATSKVLEDGHSQEWPLDISMDRNIKRLVDEKWDRYGF